MAIITAEQGNLALTNSAIGGGVLGAGIAGGLKYVAERNAVKEFQRYSGTGFRPKGDEVKLSGKAIKSMFGINLPHSKINWKDWKNIAKASGVGAVVGVVLGIGTCIMGAGINALFNFGKK